MDSNYRIILSTSYLNIESWTYLYRFIDSIYTNDREENKVDALYCLKEKNIEVRYAPKSNSDVNQLCGKELTDDVLQQFREHTCFSILYKKCDDAEEFTVFVPFVLFLRRFINAITQKSYVSLGIDTDGMNDKAKANIFYFKSINFFTLFQEVKPVLGYNTLYFFSEKSHSTISLAKIGKRREHIRNPNKLFLPLLQITEDNYHSIFTASGISTNEKSNDYSYINESLNIITDVLKNKILKTQESKFDLISNYSDSLFGQWLVNGFFCSYKPEELRSLSIVETKALIQTLQVYKNSIFELIQNIIFHGGRSGLFYCVFDKKDNVSSYYQNRLPDLGKNNKVNCFLRVGVYDFSETGIADSFKKRESINKGKGQIGNFEDSISDLTLINFFDTNSISRIGVSRLDMRHAARLGISSFVKTVFKHKGYFIVESNEMVNGHNMKKRLELRWDDNKPTFLPVSTVNFAFGTHYEIILPILPAENLSISSPIIQRESILNLRQILETQLKADNPIKAIDLGLDKVTMIDNCTTKDEQISAIISIGDGIIMSAKSQRDEIALNLNGKDFDHTLVFKILAYMQLKAENSFKKIILINGTDFFINNFCELIYSTLLSDTTADDVPVWSNDAAIILISEQLHVQVICGDTRGKLFAINQEFQKYYYSLEKSNLPFAFENHNSNSSIESISRNFILPYDILIESSDGITPFEKYSLGVMERSLQSSDIGFFLTHGSTYIDSLIRNNYYEADMMFQNSFFAERYAFLIARNIRRLERPKGTHLVLIGYKYYSEYLLKAIKRIVDDKSVHIIIANDEIDNKKKEHLDIDMSFHFDIDSDGRKLRERVLKYPEQFQFSTIVPIGATLSTNDIIITLFKSWHKLNSQGDRESTVIDFIYNHCVIIVRDTLGSQLTELEKGQKWREIHYNQHLIETEFQNAKEIYYTILFENANSTIHFSTTNNLRLENDYFQLENNTSNSGYLTTENPLRKLYDYYISFPKEWFKERYMFIPQHSLVHPQYLMELPKVDGNFDDEQYVKELERLYLLKNDIYRGHFMVFNHHLNYFIDTESFVKRENSKKESVFIKWIKGLKDYLQSSEILLMNKPNILITSNAETESDFICAVNDQLFGGNALIVYLDVKNWRNNIVNRLSFIKSLDNTNAYFHYVDHVLLTGEIYDRTKNYLLSIKGGTTPIKFDSIITVINRLPYTKQKEIKNDVNNNLFSFINLYYPISEQECEMCKLNLYYDDLSKKTVLDSCKSVIKNHANKLVCRNRSEIEQLREIRNTQQSKRDFLLLVMTHELYYRISKIACNKANFYNLTKDVIFTELDAVYNELCGQQPKRTSDLEAKSKISEKIDKWFQYIIADEYGDLREYINQRLETDKIISFLKVISSPPLSQYIIIREYAHGKLLSVLYEIIHKKNNYTYDDLKIVKSILKSLSFLKSNALVRKDVIVGIWTILGHVINNLGKEKIEIKTRRDQINDEVCKLNTQIKNLMKESQKDIVDLSNRNILNKKRRSAFKFIDYLNYELSRISVAKESIIKDFSRDAQFYIKNAIVEDDAKATFLGDLIRKGVEMSSFDKISISKTKLSLKNDINQKEENDLFKYFHNAKISLDEIFKKEYINFLVWLFYDNTTILRKTLDSFSKELEKDSSFSFYFRDGNKLKDIESVRSSFNLIEQIIVDKINREYYFSSFKPYLSNGDGIDYVEKLIYVTYAKLKLEDLVFNSKKTSIEADLKILLEVFSEIMGSNAAFMILKKDKKLYPASVFKKNKPDFIWDYEEWFLDFFYTKQILSSYRIIYPIIPLFNLQREYNKESKQYGEQFVDFETHSLSIFVIDHPDGKTRVTITFLYDKHNPLVSNETIFRINVQEFGRLLLLLKNEIDSYLNGYLINEKVFDLKLENIQSHRKFERVYSKSNHTFSAVFEEMDEFENINENILKSLYRTWFLLTNETISFLYSSIERNLFNGEHRLSIDEENVIDVNCSLGDTFNENFITILSCLLDDYWSAKNETQKSIIVVNGLDIHNFKGLEKELSDTRIGMNKHLLRTFIAQCLHNSLAYKDHGHRNWGEIKRIEISINKSFIKIEDTYITDITDLSRKYLLLEIQKFSITKKHIQTLNCDEYSSTTLTTLQGVINYMNLHGIPYQCDYGFNKNNNFCVTIKY